MGDALIHCFQLYQTLGHSCGPVVEHTPCNQEVVGRNPVRCCAFFFFFFYYLFLLSFTSGVSLIRSHKEVHLELCIVKEKNGCLAVLPGVKQAQ